MTKQSGIQALMQAVQQYFNLMYDSDVSHFDRVFRPTAQLHGLRDGKMRMLTAQAYREILAGAPSPRSQKPTPTRSGVVCMISAYVFAMRSASSRFVCSGYLAGASSLR